MRLSKSLALCCWHTGLSFPGPDPSGVSLSGWEKPGLSGLKLELWSKPNEKHSETQTHRRTHDAVSVVTRVLLWTEAFCGMGSLCSPLTDGERGSEGALLVSGLVYGLQGGWSYSGRGGSDEWSLWHGDTWRRQRMLAC